MQGSISGEHPHPRDRDRALKKLGPDRTGFVFRNEFGGPRVNQASGKLSNFAGRCRPVSPCRFDPHMLRHSCGYRMVNQPNADPRVIQVWMGHANIQNTNPVHRAKLTKLRGLWKD